MWQVVSKSFSPRSCAYEEGAARPAETGYYLQSYINKFLSLAPPLPLGGILFPLYWGVGTIPQYYVMQQPINKNARCGNEEYSGRETISFSRVLAIAFALFCYLRSRSGWAELAHSPWSEAEFPNAGRKQDGVSRRRLEAPATI